MQGVLDAIASSTGTQPSANFVYNWAFTTAHAFKRELQPVLRVREVATALRDRGHPLAVASQSPLGRVRFSLDVTGLADIFGEHIYVTSMVPRPKPAPDIYLLAAERLAVDPAGCVVVEDSPAGAAAARACGMHAIGYAAPRHGRQRRHGDARQRRRRHALDGRAAGTHRRAGSRRISPAPG